MFSDDYEFVYLKFSYVSKVAYLRSLNITPTKYGGFTHFTYRIDRQISLDPYTLEVYEGNDLELYEGSSTPLDYSVPDSEEIIDIDGDGLVTHTAYICLIFEPGHSRDFNFVIEYAYA